MMVALVCRLALAAVFGFAAVTKALDPSGFVYDIHAFQLTPWALSKLLGSYLPALEAVVAIALLIPNLRRGALLGVIGLCCVFAGAIASAWARGMDIGCGCFGSGGSSNYGLHLAGLGLMGAAAVIAWRLDRT